jgi:hypothetical protein
VNVSVLRTIDNIESVRSECLAQYRH